MDFLKDLEAEINVIEEKVLGKREYEEEVQPPKVEDTPEVKADTIDSIGNSEETEDNQSDSVERKERNDWKKRYKSLKSHHDASQHSLRQEVSSLTAENVRLQEKLNLSLQELNSLKNNSEDIYKDLFSEEEKDIVGEDTLSTMKKAIKVAVETANKPLQEQLENERKLRLAEKSKRVQELDNTNQSTFLSRLAELAPTFDSYDTDPKFHKWMSEPDEISGVTRSVIFKNAQNIGDVGQVAGFFNTFARLNNERETSLDANITPTSKATPTQKQKPTEGATISHRDIIKFYDDCTMGKYKGRYDLRKQIEKQIDDALRRGAVK